MLVTVLGSGNACPTARRASSGYLVEWSGRALLLDASAGTYMRALKAGLDPRALRALLLSHHHPDHTADLWGLLWALRWTPGFDGPLLLGGPPGTDRLLDAVRSVAPDGYDAPCTVAGYPMEVEGLYVEAFPARHAEGAVCLRITAEGRTLAYSGDTADCEGLRLACRDADLALLECSTRTPVEGHMTARDCEAVAAAARPCRVLLTHLGEDPDTDLPLAEDGQVVPL